MDEPHVVIDRVERSGVLARMSLYGLDVWPVIRVRLGEPHTARTPPEHRLGLAAAWTLLAGVAGLFVQSIGTLFTARRGRRRCVFFTHVACLARFDGLWHDRYCDPIAQRLTERGVDSVVLEYAPHLDRRAPTARQRVSVTLALVLAKLVSLPLAWAGGHLLRARLAQIDAAMGAEGLERYLSLAELNRLLAYIWCARVLLTAVLRLNRVSLAFVCTFYSSSSMAFVLACRRLDIDVYDIQHGVQGDRHVAYRAWRAPPSGYAALPSGFWCWDAATAADLDVWCRDGLGLHAVVGGNVWVEYVLDRRGARAGQPAGVAAGGNESAKKTVLVSLQPLVEPLRAALLDAIAASARRVRWVVRVHPATGPVRAAELAARLQSVDAHVRIQTDADDPLPLALAAADLHVTEYSSVVIEATACGVPSVALDERALQLYPAEHRAGQLVIAQTAEQILRCLGGLQRRERAAVGSGLIDNALDEIFRRKGWA